MGIDIEFNVEPSQNYITLGLVYVEPDGTWKKPTGDFADLVLTVAPEVSIESAIADRVTPGGRLFSMFLRLFALAREDERLMAILRDYEIRAAHGYPTSPEGAKTIWPPT